MSTERDEPDGRRLKLRAALDSYGFVILLAFALLAVAGAGLTYQVHGQTTTEPVEEVQSSWTQGVEYSHSATVTEPNPLFPVGSEFTDAGTYLTRVSPEPTVAVGTRYRADSASDVSVTAESELVIRSVTQPGETGQPEAAPREFWRDERQLDGATAGNVAPDEAVEQEFTLNVSEIEERIEEIEASVGTTPGEIDVRIVTAVEIEGTIEGETEQYARTVDAPIGIDGDTYSFVDPDDATDRIERTETVVVEREFGPLRSLGGPIVLLIGLLGASAFGYGRYTGRFVVTDREREYLSYLNDREEYGEWIKPVELPEEAMEKPAGRADSLGDLARLAIDADIPLFRDPGVERYHVVTDEYRYTFDPPEVPERGGDGEDTGEVSETEPVEDPATDGTTDALWDDDGYDISEQSPEQDGPDDPNDER